jgi:transposase
VALSSKIKVTLPDEGVIVRRTGKYRTVYKVLETFRNQKRQPTNNRVTIGRLDIESGMLIPNDAYWEHYKDAIQYTNQSEATVSPEIDTIQAVGAPFLVGSTLESLGVANILKNSFGKKRAAAILTTAIHMACNGNVFEYIGDWCEGHLPRSSRLTSQSASALFMSVTHAEKMSFFREWAAKQSNNDCLAYDVTSFSSYAKGIMETEWGYNRDGEKLPQINFGCYLGQRSGLPIFYVTYPGSIVDKSHMQYMMAYNSQLGVGNVCFVMDKGFCTTVNVQYMHDKAIQYVIAAGTDTLTAREAINKARGGIVSMRNRVRPGVYAYSTHSRFYGVTSNMHVYFSPELAERQRRDLYRMVEADEERLNQLNQLTKKDVKRYSARFDIRLAEDGSFTFERDYKKIDKASGTCGFFCILSNTNMDSARALDIYRRKDMIEKGFDDLKNHIDMKRMRTHSSDTTEGKMFCAFIALIAISEIANRMAATTKVKPIGKAELFIEMEKIKVVCFSDARRLINPLTKTQRIILAALGLSENDLMKYLSMGDSQNDHGS